MSFKNISFDDRDTDHIKYDNTWFITGTYNASNVGETGTLSSTDNPTAIVNFTFPEQASGFYYYGMMRSHGATYRICIDCDPAGTPQWQYIDAHNATDDGHNPPRILFSKTWPTPDVHMITLQNQPDPRFNNTSQITLDRFVLTVANDAPGTTVTDSTSPTSASSTTTHSASHGASGGLIGGVVGGILALLLLVALGVFCLLRRRRRQANLVQNVGPEMHGTSSPLSDHATYGTHAATSAQASSWQRSSMLPSAAPRKGEPPQLPPESRWDPGTSSAPVSIEPASTASGSRSQPSSYATQSYTNSTSAPSSASRSQGHSRSSRSRRSRGGSRGSSVPRRERDAGHITSASDEEDGEEDGGTLPPDYAEATRNRRRISEQQQ